MPKPFYLRFIKFPIGITVNPRRFVYSFNYYLGNLIAACAAAKRAIGTR